MGHCENGLKQERRGRETSFKVVEVNLITENSDLVEMDLRSVWEVELRKTQCLIGVMEGRKEEVPRRTLGFQVSGLGDWVGGTVR